jgi:hypothetical protein
VDADGRVEAEAAAALPGEHVLYGVLVEEAAALEEAKHAALQRALEAVHIVGRKVRRLMEGDGAIVALAEDAVEDDEQAAQSAASAHRGREVATRCVRPPGRRCPVKTASPFATRSPPSHSGGS